MSLDEQTHTSQRMTVTIDARALDGTRMGTQVHVLELVRALAGAERLLLRVLVRGEKIDGETLGLLGELPDTEILDAREVAEDTPKSAVFHRPLQTFSHDDVALACDLGERIVLSQLDLIAYHNPSYFPDARAFEDYRRASRHGMSAAERVVVFSEHTRGEMLSDELVEDERIRIVPPGLDHRPAAAPVQTGRAGTARGQRLPALPGRRLHAQEQGVRAGAARGAASASRLARGARARGRPRLARILARGRARAAGRTPGAARERDRSGSGRGGREGVADGADRRGRLPVDVRGVRAGAVRVRAAGRALPVRAPILAGRRPDRAGRDDRPRGRRAERRGGIRAAHRPRGARGAHAHARARPRAG